MYTRRALVALGHSPVWQRPFYDMNARIGETQQGAHDLISSLVKMARNVHCAFHELFPAVPEPIKAFDEKKARIAKYARGRG